MLLHHYKVPLAILYHNSSGFSLYGFGQDNTTFCFLDKKLGVPVSRVVSSFEYTLQPAFLHGIMVLVTIQVVEMQIQAIDHSYSSISYRLKTIKSSDVYGTLLPDNRKVPISMSAPESSSVDKSTYVIEAENAAEMARLTTQDRLVTKFIGGLFSPDLDLSATRAVLDIACGPGGWVLDVATVYPHMIVTGIDISELMVAYAQSQAQVHYVTNTHFRVMNALKPLDFPANTFDFINARLLFGFMPPTAWLPLLGECMRILRPGGVLRLTEGEAGITNSPATERITGMITHALYQAKQSFSPDGRHTGITPMLSRLQRMAGFVHIQQATHRIDYSKGTEAHPGMYQNFLVGYTLIQPFLITMALITPEEMDRLYQQMLVEMMADDFCAVWYLLSAWGRKPEK